jgi:23S rRNA (uracil1939-C5)-methyltransferase
VPKTIAGDEVEIRITKRNKEAIRAELVRVITPGPGRTPAPCPHFAECGGCSLQMLEKDAYHSFKTRIAAQAIKLAGYPDVKLRTLFAQPASRRRVDFKVSGGKLAYHGLRSHQLVAVDSCLILHPKLAALLPALQPLLTPALTDVSLTLTDSGIDLNLRATASIDIAPFKALKVARIVLNGKVAHEPKPLTVTFGGYSVPLPPGAFLQAALVGQQALTDFATHHTQGAKRVADLFCGVGTYSLPLSRQAQVQAYELEGQSVAALKAAIHTHELEGRLSAHSRDLFNNPLTAKELAGLSAVVVNPPRAGAQAQIEAIAQAHTHTVVMISCNPATFTRDAKILKNAGFHLTDAVAIDQFVYSPHLEIAAVFHYDDRTRL